MAFLLTNRGVWTFDDNLEDVSLSNDFTASGSFSFDNIPVFNLNTNSYVTQKGLVFSSSNSFETTLSSGFESGNYLAYIDFWWHSKSALGFTKHTITGKPTAYESPILSKANTEITSGIEAPVSGEAEFIVTEVAHSATQNKIRLSTFGDGTNISNQIDSEPYSIGLHYISISMSLTASGESRIDIDGKTGIRYKISALSDIATAKFRLNDSYSGYTAHKTNNSGSIISDLVIGRGRPSNATLPMLLGWEYIAKSDFADTFSSFGFSYNRPTTITTNQIFTEGGNIFVTRSNGEIYKGSRPIWDTDHNYLNSNSINVLNISETDDTRKAEWTTRGLKLTGTTVRI